MQSLALKKVKCIHAADQLCKEMLGRSELHVGLVHMFVSLNTFIYRRFRLLNRRIESLVGGGNCAGSLL